MRASWRDTGPTPGQRNWAWAVLAELGPDPKPRLPEQVPDQWCDRFLGSDLTLSTVCSSCNKWCYVTVLSLVSQWLNTTSRDFLLEPQWLKWVVRGTLLALSDPRWCRLHLITHFHRQEKGTWWIPYRLLKLPPITYIVGQFPLRSWLTSRKPGKYNSTCGWKERGVRIFVNRTDDH